MDDITPVHEKSTMMFIFQEMVQDIAEFKAFLVYEFHNKKTEFFVKSQTKVIFFEKLWKKYDHPKTAITRTVLLCWRQYALLM